MEDLVCSEVHTFSSSVEEVDEGGGGHRIASFSFSLPDSLVLSAASKVGGYYHTSSLVFSYSFGNYLRFLLILLFLTFLTMIFLCFYSFLLSGGGA